MTTDPLEVMAKAAWNAIADEFNQWDELGAEEKIMNTDGQRAALLALSECDLSEAMINDGWEGDHDADRFENDFRSMLKKLAEGG